MSKNRKGGLVGRNNSLENPIPSGVWSATELAIANSYGGEKAGPKGPITERKVSSEVLNPDTDPYYTYTNMHITTEDVDWFHKDRSGNNWHWYMQKADDYRVNPMVRSGPKYPYWSIVKTHKNSAYRVYANTDVAQRFNADPFTIDFWYQRHIKDATQRYIMGRGGQAGTSSGTGWVVGWDTSYNLFFYDAVANVTHKVSGITTLADTWYFVSICRASTGSNDFTININGTNYYTGTCASNFDDTGAVVLLTDRVATAATDFVGMLADVRFSGNSTPTALPTGPLDMTGAKYSHSITSRDWENVRDTTGASHQPQGYDQTVIQYLSKEQRNPWEDDPAHAGYKRNYLTGKGSSSWYNQDGRGYLILDKNASNTDLRFGTNPFTVEAWVYGAWDASGTNTQLLGKGVNASSGWAATAQPNNMRWEDGGSYVQTPYSSNDIRGVWNHYAWVREGTGTNQFYMYLNGIRVYVGTISTNYTQTEDLYVGKGRNNAYGYYGYISGIRISNTARYTGDSFTPDIDTTLEADANTIFLLHSPEVDSDGVPNSSEANLFDLGWARMAHWTNQFYGLRPGQRMPLGKWGSSIINTVGYNNSCTTVYTSVAYYWDIDYPTKRDFSVEMWVKPRSRENTQQSCLFDMRPSGNWNANTIAIYHNQFYSSQGGIYVLRNGQVFLSGYADWTYNEWRHVCLTRIGDVWRLYINGKLMESRYDTTSLTTYNMRKITIANGSHDVDNIKYFYGNIKDVRFAMGASEYPAGDFIDIPQSELRPTANTTFLTHNKFGLLDTANDYYSNEIQVWSGYYDVANYGRPGNAWTMEPSPTSPYLLRPKVDGYNPATDVLLSDVGGELERVDHTTCAIRRFWSTDAGNDLFFGRLDKPFTYEMFIWGQETTTGAPSGTSVFYSATTTGHTGIYVLFNFSSGTSSFQRINLRWFTNGTVYDYNTNYAWDYRAPKIKSWNHFAFSYDPTQPSAERFALWCNGYRQQLTSAPPPLDNSVTTYVSNPHSYTAGYRLSTSVRYDHQSSTYTVPEKYELDDNTYYCMGQMPNTMTNNTGCDTIYNQGPVITDNCKMEGFGNNILFLSNQTVTSKTNRITLGQYAWADHMRVFKPWDDWTIECWAAWQPAAVGGKNFTTYQYIWSFNNYHQCGLNSSGQWMFWRATDNSDGSLTTKSNMTISTGVYAALTTENRMDHVVMCHKNGNIYCYVNGILMGTLINAQWGTSSYAPNSNSPQENYYTSINVSDYCRVGADWHSRQDRSWQGVMNDFRFTHIARYDNAVINGVNTMVYRDTMVPALPTQRFPKNEQRSA